VEQETKIGLILKFFFSLYLPSNTHWVLLGMCPTLVSQPW